MLLIQSQRMLSTAAMLSLSGHLTCAVFFGDVVLMQWFLLLVVLATQHFALSQGMEVVPKEAPLPPQDASDVAHKAAGGRSFHGFKYRSGGGRHPRKKRNRARA